MSGRSKDKTQIYVADGDKLFPPIRAQQVVHRPIAPACRKSLSPTLSRHRDSQNIVAIEDSPRSTKSSSASPAILDRPDPHKRRPSSTIAKAYFTDGYLHEQREYRNRKSARPRFVASRRPPHQCSRSPATRTLREERTTSSRPEARRSSSRGSTAVPKKTVQPAPSPQGPFQPLPIPAQAVLAPQTTDALQRKVVQPPPIQQAHPQLPTTVQAVPAFQPYPLQYGTPYYQPAVHPFQSAAQPYFQPYFQPAVQQQPFLPASVHQAAQPPLQQPLAAIGRKILQFDEMSSLVADVEAIVNSRPLTHIYDDFRSGSILRPIDFLIPNAQPGLCLIETADSSDPTWLPPQATSRDKLLAHWEKTSTLQQKFWDLWHMEYLHSLQERAQRFHKGPRSQVHAVPEVGEIVILEEENIPRGSWKLAKVVEVCRSPDNYIRSAKVQLPNRHILRRPVNRLYPMEVNRSTDDEPHHTSLVAAAASPRRKFPFFLIAALCLLSFSPASEAAPCASDLTRQNRPIHYQTCVKEGYAVFNDTNGHLCGRKISCAQGHLRLDDSTENSSSICREECTCPTGAAGCSFYTGEDTSLSTTSFANTVAILKNMAPQMCAIGQFSSECNPKPVMMRLPEVLLYDDTWHFVSELQLNFRETDIKEFTCIGEGPITGSSRYCENNGCYENGTQFCYYDKPEIVEIQSDLGSVPIKAWRFSSVAAYTSSLEHKEHQFSINASCIRGGVQVATSTLMEVVEVCTSLRCFYLRQVKDATSLLLTPNITLYEYKTTIKFWRHGKLAQKMQRVCPANPFCETLSCTFCLERVYNPQCASWLETIAVVLTIYIFISIFSRLLSILLKAVACAGIALHVIKSFARGVWTVFKRLLCCCWARRRQSSTSLKPRRRRSSFSYKPHMYHIAIVTAIALLSTTALGCTEVTTITGHSHECRTKANGQSECTFTEATLLSLVPYASPSCIMLMDHEKNILATLHVSIDSLYLECQRKSEYFTRDFTHHVHSGKRCFSAGSCTQDKCLTTRTNDMIPELDGIANDSPGHTHCTPSCGSVFCGCWYDEKGCLFYRVYARPESDKIYEVFTCPLWKPKAQITLRLDYESGEPSEEHVFTMSPGHSARWNHLTATLSSMSASLLPGLMNAVFITDSEVTGTLRTATDPLLTQSFSELRCATKDMARRFNCSLSPGACDCSHEGYKVVCKCQPNPLAARLEDPKHQIPQHIGDAFLQGHGESLRAHLKENGAVQLQLNVEKLTTSKRIDDNQCTIEHIATEGCYSCATAAEFRAICFTDFGTARARITCEGNQVYIPCSANGSTSLTKMHFDRRNIDITCSVTCPKGTSTFTLRTILAYLPAEEVSEIIEVTSSQIQESSRALWIWNHLPSFSISPALISSLSWALTLVVSIPLILFFGLIVLRTLIITVIKKVV
ncbi:hypothetical protein QR680_014739 [Steinernema hermaphroditum]|uniref:Phlebovirus glycoprotein G2 fusion domain-containing protein n=1 Tax=Steinernema hermaphroditum TaxID=289476 RepID=A0AA39M3Q9_9BILA|nr:hypothetical protein QR680_014739 [Steinernema hermaphroditum]